MKRTAMTAIEVDVYVIQDYREPALAGTFDLGTL